MNLKEKTSPSTAFKSFEGENKALSENWCISPAAKATVHSGLCPLRRCPLKAPRGRLIWGQGSPHRPSQSISALLSRAEAHLREPTDCWPPRVAPASDQQL